VVWRNSYTTIYTCWTSYIASSCVCWCSSVYTAWHRSILPSYVYQLPMSWGAVICALPLNFFRNNMKNYGRRAFSCAASHAWTHCQNISDRVLQSTFSHALWKRFYSGRYRVLHIGNILFNGIYKFILLTDLLTYSSPWRLQRCGRPWMLVSPDFFHSYGSPQCPSHADDHCPWRCFWFIPYIAPVPSVAKCIVKPVSDFASLELFFKIHINVDGI